MKPETFSKFLVINTAGLGDVVLSTPVPRAIRKWKPDAKVDFLCWEAARPLLDLNPSISGVRALDKTLVTKGALLGSWAAQIRLMAALRREHYDLILDLSPNGRTLVQALASGARHKATIHYGRRTGSMTSNCRFLSGSTRARRDWISFGLWGSRPRTLHRKSAPTRTWPKAGVRNSGL